MEKTNNKIRMEDTNKGTLKLNFTRLNDKVYSVINIHNQHICNIQLERTGKFMHWCMVMPLELMEEMVSNDEFVIFSPGCQDMIREFCRKLGGKKSD